MTKKAIVTGASSGIGKLFSERLLKDGWEVTGVARSEDILKTIFKDGQYLIADLSTEAGINHLETHIKSNKYDLLINNAGYGLYGRFGELDIDHQINMMHLNMDALVRLSHAYLNTAVSGDALMNISSALSLMPMPGISTYSGTKSFVTAFTQCLWYEYKDKGIYVFADLPGAVKTNFHEVAGADQSKMNPTMLLEPELVVSEALKALKKRKKPFIVNGNQYRFFTRLGQILPSRMRLSMLAKNSQGLK